MGSTLRTLAIEGCPSTHQPLSGHLFPPPSSRGPTVHSERVVSIAPAPLPLTSQRVCHTLAEKRCGPPSADLQMRGKKWEVLCRTPAALRPPPPPPPPPPLPPPLCTLEILTTLPKVNFGKPASVCTCSRSSPVAFRAASRSVPPGRRTRSAARAGAAASPCLPAGKAWVRRASCTCVALADRRDTTVHGDPTARGPPIRSPPWSNPCLSLLLRSS